MYTGNEVFSESNLSRVDGNCYDQQPISDVRLIQGAVIHRNALKYQ